MQTVLRERPADPAARLAEILLKNAGTVAKLPVPSKAQKEAKSARRGTGRPTIVRAGSFGGYYRENFRAARHPEGLYSGFPTARPQHIAAPPSQGAATAATAASESATVQSSESHDLDCPSASPLDMAAASESVKVPCSD